MHSVLSIFLDLLFHKVPKWNNYSSVAAESSLDWVPLDHCCQDSGVPVGENRWTSPPCPTPTSPQNSQLQISQPYGVTSVPGDNIYDTYDLCISPRCLHTPWITALIWDQDPFVQKGLKDRTPVSLPSWRIQMNTALPRQKGEAIKLVFK